MKVWSLIFGRPLKISELQHEEIGTPEGLAALSLDALSSVAYGPESIAVVLMAGGAGALSLLLPVSYAIVGLLVVLVLSYSQVIEAYPGGGGAYAVSKDNLGAFWSLLAAASLFVDYLLTVTVSISAGVAAMTSAFPPLAPYTLLLCLALLAVITVFNLRGVGESARAFLLPAFVFILGILAVVAFGVLRAHPAIRFTGTPYTSTLTETVGWILILKAFASGCTALTGVEAITNGVPLFRTPKIRNAKQTLALLGLLLGIMILGLGVVAHRFHLEPLTNQTLLSQATAAALGRGPAYYVITLSTTAVLGLAANTSFAGLPLLASVLAKDHYVPHIFAVRGDRLVYHYGIGVLAAAAALLLIAAGGVTQVMIPLYTIGVFTGFTLSQTGMVAHWHKVRPPSWRIRGVLNGLGAVVTGTATLIFVSTKFLEGAWLVVLVIPALIFLFRRIHGYYLRVGLELGLDHRPPGVHPVHTPLVVVPISGISTLTGRALNQALAISRDVLAVTVAFEPGAEEREKTLRAEWEAWQPGVRLVVLRSQYQSVVRPLLRFIGSLDRQLHERVWVLIPEVVPREWHHQFLHNQMGRLLDRRLRHRTDVVVARIPMHLLSESEPPTPGSRGESR